MSFEVWAIMKIQPLKSVINVMISVLHALMDPILIVLHVILGNFSHENGCYNICPDGYYGDTNSWTCKVWDQACTKWYGSSRSECTEWNSTLLQSLVGNIWNKVNCLSQQYLNTTDIKCYDWEPGCNSCKYPWVSNCQQWDSAYKMVTDGTWTYWDSILGYELNNLGECVESCGDGLNFGEYEWDDGNLLNGDGCSSNCEVEQGFACENITCWEIIPPNGRISQVTKDNIWTVKFSESVVITNFSAFELSLRANIQGPIIPYKFDFKIYDPNNTTRNSVNLTEFQVKIYNIESHIVGNGTEQIQLWLKNSSLVKDLKGNILSKGKFIGDLSYFEYISGGNFNIFKNNTL